jgi:hypothetical protein
VPLQDFVRTATLEIPEDDGVVKGGESLDREKSEKGESHGTEGLGTCTQHPSGDPYPFARASGIPVDSTWRHLVREGGGILPPTPVLWMTWPVPLVLTMQSVAEKGGSIEHFVCFGF